MQVPLNKNMEAKAMKMRTLGLVAGMALIAATAGFSQAAGIDKKADTNLNSNAASGVPDILGSFDNASAYQEMNGKEMKKIQGEATWTVTISRSTGTITKERTGIFPLFRTVTHTYYVD
jgi:hypothetical protein